MSENRIHLSLNGPWRLVLDPGDAGVGEAWFREPPKGDAIQVEVPSVWDRWVPDYDGVGWYFREFEAGAEWEDRYVTLEFDAADYVAEVWLNGVRLGDHEGGYTPFSLKTGAALRRGNNLLAVRIIDPHGPGGFGDFKPKQIPQAKEEGYYSFAGIWGNVSLLGRPHNHIRDVFVQPDIRRKRITATVDVTGGSLIRAQILDTEYATEAGPGQFVLDFPRYELWAPETPKLYTLRCELLHDGRVCDSIDTRFGMREFSVKERRFYLNNRPYFVKAALHQPDYPRSLVAPESVEVARRELELAKEAGFNMLRLHIKTAPKITLNLADEIGLLLYEEPPIGWIQKSPWMRGRCEREVREMILRDRNHPSVVIWGMLNETGNADYVTHGGAQTVKDELCRLARQLDPSRLIIDDSGGVNATREPARMMRPYHSEFEPYDDLHIYQRGPVDREIEAYYRNSGSSARLFFLSEFGFGGAEDLEDALVQYGAQRDFFKDARYLQRLLAAIRKGFDERELDRVFGDFASFTAAQRDLQATTVKLQIDALRANPKLAGYCYTQLCDAGHEFCAGALDRWRRPKPVLKAMKEAQAPLRPLIQIGKTNLTPREEVAVSVTIINDAREEGPADLSLQVVGPTNQVLWKKKRGINLGRGAKIAWSGAISASGSAGAHRFVVRLIRSMKVVAETSRDFYVFEPAKPSDVEIHVAAGPGNGAGLLFKWAREGERNAPVHIIPPHANSIRAYPPEALLEALGQARDGAVALVFSPPKDWNDLAARLPDLPQATSRDAVGAFLGKYHYTKLHPVFEGLPSRGLMGQPYRDIVPAFTFAERSDEDICGTFDAMPAAGSSYMADEEAAWWGSDILVRRYGSGRVVFTHLRILDHLDEDPVAQRLFVNLLNHFARRSVPSEGTPHVDQVTLEWLRAERERELRRWMCLGMFPNEDGEGFAKAYPPESRIDFDAAYQGWYKTIRWTPWYARKAESFLVDLQEVFTPVYEYYPRFDYGTGYAYAEFTVPERRQVRLKLGLQDPTKIWLNGVLVHESHEHVPHDQFHECSLDALAKQGRNTVLVKVCKIPGPFRFALDIESTGPESTHVKWWR